MVDILFTILIYPIKLLMECIYAVLYVSLFKGNDGLALALLSVVVNTLCLPLYIKAEKLQGIERETQKRMAKKLSAIRECSTGDERWLLTSAYYRQNQYHPIYALRSSLSLLLQVPFFIAAYSFLSRLASLQGKSLFFISDLSEPDAAFSIGGFPINILPIIMTIINIIAGIIYSKGFPFKEKIQLYAMSLIFLILLYHSPSALVLYWTMNNLYSLAKNILFKIKNPLRIVYLAGCIMCFIFMIYVCFIRYNFPARAFRNKTIAVLLFLMFLGIPIYIKLTRYIFRKRLEFIFEIKNMNAIFISSCAVLWLLTACFIPLNTAASDPAHFARVAETFETNLFLLLFSPVIQGFGLFFFWPICLYFLAPRRVRSVIAVFGAASAACALLNFFVFNGNYGVVSQTLTFNLPDGVYLHKGVLAQLVNIFICFFILILICVIIFFKKNIIIPQVLTICIISICILSIIKISSISKFFLDSADLSERTE